MLLIPVARWGIQPIDFARTLSYHMDEILNPTTAQCETTLVVLHRREMRLRHMLSSAFVSRENRREAHEELMTILDETRRVEAQLAAAA